MEENLKKSTSEIDAFDKKLNDLKSKVNSFEAKIKETKIKKLQRDGKDYLQNQVYKWLERPRTINTFRKKVTWVDNRSDLESTSTEDSASSSADECSSYNFRPSRGICRGFEQQNTNSNFGGKRRGRGKKKV